MQVESVSDLVKSLTILSAKTLLSKVKTAFAGFALAPAVA